VKGLDFALLEQNRAKAMQVSDAFDDESLENVFKEVSSTSQPSKPNRRTREELLNELKAKRIGGQTSGTDAEQASALNGEVRVLEEAKQKGKFKPIGFKPIGESSTSKKKKRPDGDDKEKKKKKRKVETFQPPQPVPAEPSPTEVQKIEQSNVPAPLESEPVDNDDFDIFAGAGEYDGLDLGDDDDEEAGAASEDPSQTEQTGQPPISLPKAWIPVEDDGPVHRSPSPPAASKPPLSIEKTFASGDDEPTRESYGPPPGIDFDFDMEDQPTKLVPLSSSALPDIKALLEMDKASISRGKNKKKKEKKAAAATSGAPGAPDAKVAEAKAERDYKRLVFLFLRSVAYGLL